jgi:anti-anti-sigma regulatory factor
MRIALIGSVLRSNMFKISIVDTRTQRKLVVEGKLSEPWVEELRTTWRNASRDLDGRRVVIDLSNLTVISREGEDAIFDLMKQGAKFSCAGILTRHVLKRLARRCQCTPSQVLEKKQ